MVEMFFYSSLIVYPQKRERKDTGFLQLTKICQEFIITPSVGQLVYFCGSIPRHGRTGRGKAEDNQVIVQASEAHFCLYGAIQVDVYPRLGVLAPNEYGFPFLHPTHAILSGFNRNTGRVAV